MKNTETKKIIELSDQLYKASRSIRILRSINWDAKVREEFFRLKEDKLPQVSYPDYDPSETLDILKGTRKLIPKNAFYTGWAERIAYKLENSALLLSSMGKPEFHLFSKELYGVPEKLLPDGETTTLQLAQHFDHMYDNIDQLNIEPEDIPSLGAKDVVAKMKREVKQMFGADAPKVYIDKEVSSNVIAGRRRIRVRESAIFSDKDIDQLLHHEAFIHVSTSINGHNQDNLKILSAAHPGTTKTQEGLAVFAEFISANLDLDRLRRLSDRVVAIQMAIDGADFIEVYRYYKERTPAKEQAFESTRRVFRGGLITGKAPFTKDIVYLDGLLRVHNFLRVVVSAGRADVLPLLFVGKLNLKDIGTLMRFQEIGILKAPKYLPPWMLDIRFLVTYLSYSSFLNSVRLNKLKDFYESMIRG